MTRTNWLVVLLYLCAMCVAGIAVNDAGKAAERQKKAEQASEIKGRPAQEAPTEAESARRAEAVKREQALRSCKWSVTYEPTKKDLRAMAGAKGTQTISIAYSGNILADISWAYVDFLAPGADDGHFTLGGQNAQVCRFAWGNVIYKSSISFLGGTDNAAVRAAVLSWAAGNPYASPISFWICWATQAGTGTGATADRVLTVNGYHAKTPGPPPQPPMVWDGDTEIDADLSFSLSNAYPRTDITENLPSGQSNLRHPCQRSSSTVWYGDASTEITVACGGASYTANFGLGGETDITNALALGWYIRYSGSPQVAHPYIVLTASAGDGDAAPLDLSYWHWYKTVAVPGTWVWYGDSEDGTHLPVPSDAATAWKTVPGGNSITIHRCAGGSNSAVTWLEAVKVAAVQPVHRLFKQNKDPLGVTSWAQYTEYDTSQGNPFGIGLYRHWSGGVQQTEDEVSVAPIFDPEEAPIYVEQWGFGNPVPDDVWRKFTNLGDGYRCKLRKRWMEANDEDVVFTDPDTTKDVPRTEDEVEYPLIDIPQPCAIHDLLRPFAGDPWASSPWMTFARQEFNLDKPDGTHRPSPWVAGVGAVVSGETWTASIANGAVERTLASRRPNRYRRISAHLWTGSGDQQEVTYRWLVMTRADLPECEPGEASGDDAKWHDPNAEPWPGDDPGVSFEDITDWQTIAKLGMQFTGAAEDQLVSMTVHYQELTGSCPRYPGAKYAFGVGYGEASAVLGEVQTATISATLSASTGIVEFDLAPDAPNTPNDFYYVSKVEFSFEKPATLTFAGFYTTPFDPDHPQYETTMRIAQKHSTDYFGARVYLDGMPNYKPRYLYTQDAERNEVGFKDCDDLQHDPDYEGEPDDPRSLKSLADFHNELSWAQSRIVPTWHQDALDASLKDEDDAVMATPVWGDMDEDGFAIRVGTVNGPFFPLQRIYSDTILQGGDRGIAKIAGVRQTNRTDGLKLYYSDDYGATKTLVRDVGTGYAGEYRVGAGREKAPRRYWLNETELGGFVNAEELWYSIFLVSPGDLHIAHHPVSGQLLVTEHGMLGCTSQLRIRNGPGWSERADVPDSGYFTSAVTPTNITNGHLLVCGDGHGIYLRTQTNLLGEWGSLRALAVPGTYSHPVGIAYQGRLFVLANATESNLVQCMSFDLSEPNGRWPGDLLATVAGTDGLACPGIAKFDDLWTLVAAVANDPYVFLSASTDSGATWPQKAAIQDCGGKPALCSLEHDLWLATYKAESYLGAQGRCEVRRIKARGNEWTVGDALSPLPSDAGRPAIYADPATYLLTVLTPKWTQWGLAGAIPGIVEYTSRDGGETWSDAVVHGIA